MEVNKMGKIKVYDGDKVLLKDAKRACYFVEGMGILAGVILGSTFARQRIYDQMNKKRKDLREKFTSLTYDSNDPESKEQFEQKIKNMSNAELVSYTREFYDTAGRIMTIDECKKEIVNKLI